MLSAFRPFLAVAAGFSLVINLLLLAPMLFMYQVYDRVLASRSVETLVVLAVVTASAMILLGLMEALRSRLMHGAAVLLDQRYAPRVMRVILDEMARPGSRANTDVFKDIASMRSLLTGGGVLALFDAPWMLVFLGIIFLFHPVLGLLAVVAALIMLVLAFFNDRFTRDATRRMQAHARESNRFFETVARNADVVAGMGMGQAATERWLSTHQRMLREQTDSGRVGSAFSGATKFFRQFIQSLMLALGAWLVIDNSASPGVMIATTLLLGRALAPVEQAVGNWRNWIEGFEAYKRIARLMDKTAVEAAQTALPRPEGALQLEDVSLAMEQGGRWVLRNVNLGLEPGETLVVVGPSASGKSCLTRLLVGAWKPTLGTVRLDGADVSHWDRIELGRYVGYLPQDVELFSGTVAENIARLQEPDAEEVIAAARRARVHDLILRLAEGYDTQIGEGGAVLSGGQRQRVGFARALYGNPSLVVLDEPNANLDTAGEAALAAAIKRLKADGVTVVLVTQRLSILAMADKVLALRKGRQEFFGSRAQYLAEIRKGMQRTVAPAHPLPPQAMAAATLTGKPAAALPGSRAASLPPVRRPADQPLRAVEPQPVPAGVTGARPAVRAAPSANRPRPAAAVIPAPTVNMPSPPPAIQPPAVRVAPAPTPVANSPLPHYPQVLAVSRPAPTRRADTSAAGAAALSPVPPVGPVRAPAVVTSRTGVVSRPDAAVAGSSASQRQVPPASAVVRTEPATAPARVLPGPRTVPAPAPVRPASAPAAARVRPLAADEVPPPAPVAPSADPARVDQPAAAGSPAADGSIAAVALAFGGTAGGDAAPSMPAGQGVTVTRTRRRDRAGRGTGLAPVAFNGVPLPRGSGGVKW